MAGTCYREPARISKYNIDRYPVIVSLEMHCSLEQQTFMAKFMREIFGGNSMTSSFLIPKFLFFNNLSSDMKTYFIMGIPV